MNEDANQTAQRWADLLTEGNAGESLGPLAQVVCYEMRKSALAAMHDASATIG